MEKLSHIINQQLHDRLWKPVKISREGLEISHLFFTDDLILFGLASENQANVMRECLESFCDLSGEQISFSKCRVFCSNNIGDAKAKKLAELCGSPLTKNMGNYLGIPLIHDCINKGTYNYILEKSQKRLPS